MHLQKEKIIKRAIEVLDRDGLDGVTLRRLAKELDAQAASIYYHIPHKEALLGAMANAILEEYFGDFDFADDKKDWATWLDTLGHALRTAMLAHREAGRVVAGAHLGDVLTKLYDLTIRILHNAGFSYSKASTITVTVTDFTFGFVIEEQSSPSVVDAPGEFRSFRQFPTLMAADGPRSFEQFPTLMAAMEIWMQEDWDTHFDTSMRLIINGVRAELQLSGEVMR